MTSALETTEHAPAQAAEGMTSRELTSRLQELYPATFCNPRKPLKIGIAKDILAKHPEFNKDTLSRSLHWWTAAISYHNAVLEQEPRVDLTGAAGDKPDDAAIRNAISQLVHLRKSPRDQIDIRTLHPSFKKAKTIQVTAEIDTPLASEDRDFILGLLERHPHANAKIGSGVSEIRVVADPQGRRKFILVRADKSRDDFSVLKCFDFLLLIVPQAAKKVSKPNPDAARPNTAAQTTPAQGRITVKAVKIAIAMRRDQFPILHIAEGQDAPEHVKLSLKNDSVTMTSSIGRKTYRKATKTLSENSNDGHVIIQGTLGNGGIIEEAGIVLQLNKPSA